MTGELRVTTEHLRKLSAKQHAVAAQTAAAALAAGGVSTSMWVNHGLICAPTNIAVSNAELARRNACLGIQSTSTDLAEKLDNAATQYDQTDAQARDKIAGKMRPR
jgi:Excreted virulence factor EspC, type VII ESX diderm